MSASDVFLSVIIPAYNEEKRLPATLDAVLRYLQRQPYTWEIDIVDDGSHDATAQIVRNASARDQRVTLWQYGKNRGKGYAVQYGMTHARGQYRLFMDADNSTTIDHLDQFMPYITEGYDVVIGSRHIAGADIAVHQAWWKEWLGKLGNVWIRVWAVPHIHDTQAGFKVFSARAAKAVFPYLTLSGWGFDVEALAVARHRGFRIAEHPIRWRNDPNSKVKPGAYLHVLVEVVKVRLNLIGGRYG